MDSAPSEPPAIRGEILPYATRGDVGLTAPGLFGVVVRTLGLGMTLWGAYSLFYAASTVLFNAPANGYPVTSFVTYGLFLTTCGLVLLRGNWLVRLAYGRHGQ